MEALLEPPAGGPWEAVRSEAHDRIKRGVAAAGAGASATSMEVEEMRLALDRSKTEMAVLEEQVWIYLWELFIRLFLFRL